MAQSSLPKAKFDSNLALTIDATAPLSSSYILDFSGMSFKDEQSASIFFKALADNLIHWEMNYTDKTAKLFLHTQYKEGWTTSDWDSYFSTNAERYKLTYNRVNTH